MNTKVDYAFILAAGLGTRMGELGRYIPKPLWPVFEKTLLELQIKYVESLGINNIYVNTHYLADQVEKKISELKNNQIKISFEKQILDIGGGIHRIAEMVHYNGNMLVLNCDQFLWLTKENIQEMLSMISGEEYVVMASIKVNPQMGYNGIKIENSKFKGVIPADDLKNVKRVDTYGGVCLIDLNRLPKKEGVTKYFDSVVDLKNPKAVVWNAEKNEYWDFGTKYRFALSHWELLSDFHLGGQGQFLNFLINQGAIKTEKISATSYGSTVDDTFILPHIKLSRNSTSEWDIQSDLMPPQETKDNLL